MARGVWPISVAISLVNLLAPLDIAPTMVWSVSSSVGAVARRLWIVTRKRVPISSKLD